MIYWTVLGTLNVGFFCSFLKIELLLACSTTKRVEDYQYSAAFSFLVPDFILTSYLVFIRSVDKLHVICKCFLFMRFGKELLFSFCFKMFKSLSKYYHFLNLLHFLSSILEYHLWKCSFWFLFLSQFSLMKVVVPQEDKVLKIWLIRAIE